MAGILEDDKHIIKKDMKYKLLIVAFDCHNSHMTRFVYNLKQENPEAEIHFFTDKEKEELPEELTGNVSKILYFKQDKCQGTVGKIKSIISLRRQFKELSKHNSYDIVDIHFPKFYMVVAMGYLRRMSKKVVASPWGSDILRVNGIKFRVLASGVLNKCDYITTLVDGNLGKKILSYLPNSRDKFYPQAWGSETIDYINHHLNEVDTIAAKKHFGLSDKYVITCGYNAFRAQNHEKIIDAIVQVRSQLPDNLALLFPVSYGTNDKEEYVAELREKCNNHKLDALFMEDYMSVPDVFMLRMATDMFVHTQNTDAGCASLQEYVLCDKKIVHGSWIRYPMLEIYQPLCYHTASDFSVLGDVIVETYRSAPIEFSKDAIRYIQSNGWEEKRKGWNGMFEEIALSK